MWVWKGDFDERLGSRAKAEALAQCPFVRVARLYKAIRENVPRSVECGCSSMYWRDALSLLALAGCHPSPEPPQGPA